VADRRGGEWIARKVSGSDGNKTGRKSIRKVFYRGGERASGGGRGGWEREEGEKL